MDTCPNMHSDISSSVNASLKVTFGRLMSNPKIKSWPRAVSRSSSGDSIPKSSSTSNSNSCLFARDFSFRLGTGHRESTAASESMFSMGSVIIQSSKPSRAFRIVREGTSCAVRSGSDATLAQQSEKREGIVTGWAGPTSLPRGEGTMRLSDPATCPNCIFLSIAWAEQAQLHTTPAICCMYIAIVATYS